MAPQTTDHELREAAIAAVNGIRALADLIDKMIERRASGPVSTADDPPPRAAIRHFDTRTRKALIRVAIRTGQPLETIDDIAGLTEEQILVTHGCGRAVVESVAEYLGAHGLRLRGTPPIASDKPHEQPWTTLPLSVRTSNILATFAGEGKIRLVTVADLSRLPSDQVIERKNAGETTLADIAQALKTVGLSPR